MKIFRNNTCSSFTKTFSMSSIKFIVVFLLFFFTFKTQAQDTLSLKQKTEVKLETTINKFAYYSADKVLDEIAKDYKLKIKYQQDRLEKYELEEQFNETKLSEVLHTICKRTQSKFYINKAGEICVIGRDENENENAVQVVERYHGQPTRFKFNVTGKVVDIRNGEPLPYVTLGISGTTIGVYTNVDGGFTLTNVPSDTSIIFFTYLGCETYHWCLSPTEKLDGKLIELSPSTKTLQTVKISAKQVETFKLNEKTSMIKLTPEKIATLPNVGEKDIFRAYQLMPGVSAANENSAGLYVRGGTPDQVLVLYDGFTVYNVEHLFGFYSAFNSNAIKSVDLYKGSFESKFGGRLSSVVDITGKEGNKKYFNGGVDLSLMSLNAFVEAPIGKKITTFFSYRRSYQGLLYDAIFNKYSKSTTQTQTQGGGRFARSNASNKVTSFFYDMNAKFTYKPTNKDVVALSFYDGKDKLDNSIKPSSNGFGPPGGTGGGGFSINQTDLTKWGNIGGSLKWSRQWHKKFYSNSLLSYSNYFSNRDNSTSGSFTDASGNSHDIKNGTLENNNLDDYTAKTDFEYKPINSNSIEFGVAATHNKIKYTYSQNDTSTIIDKNSNGNTIANYLQDRIKLFHSKLEILPGIRYTYFDVTQKFYTEPRLNMSYNITDKIKLKSSYGTYYQFAKRVIKEDILQGSRDFWLLSDDKKIPISVSTQYVLGASYENKKWLFDVESYYKEMSGLSEYTLRFTPSIGTISYNEYFYTGKGYTRGIDFLLQKKEGKYNGWIAYTLAEAMNQFNVYGNNYFYASNDVKHEFKTVHMYKWKDWDFSLSWIYATGKPFTAPEGGYTVSLLDGSTKDYITVSEKNGKRLPDYHRLDIAATYNFKFKNGNNGSIGFSIFNLYARKNVWYMNYQIVDGKVVETPVYYMGLIPNITLSYKLK